MRFAPGPGGRPKAKCPHCRSLARHRFLAYLFDRLAPVIATARLVLDIAPQAAVQHRLLHLAGDGRYLGVDLEAHRRVGALASLEQLPLRDDSADVAICYHVLEHVFDDRAAIGELARVLSPGGLLVLQVPIQRGRPTEHDPHAPPERLLERFGHADHRRLYGDDFEERLLEGGLAATLTHPRDYLPQELHRRYGLNNQPVWLCRKVGPQHPRPPAQLDAALLRAGEEPPAPPPEPPPAPQPAAWARLRRVPGVRYARPLVRGARRVRAELAQRTARTR